MTNLVFASILTLIASFPNQEKATEVQLADQEKSEISWTAEETASELQAFGCFVSTTQHYRTITIPGSLPGFPYDVPNEVTIPSYCEYNEYCLNWPTWEHRTWTTIGACP